MFVEPKLRRSVLGVENSRVVALRYPIRAKLETDLVIPQAKEIVPQTTTPDLDPVCVGRTQYGYKRSPGLLLNNTQPSQAYQILFI
ncbi:hypothetical protein TNCV_736941 [Trichonephila clavipes]|nr:hypothetical protein TNCV_736941 [Trichonephila clavipes]